MDLIYDLCAVVNHIRKLDQHVHYFAYCIDTTPGYWIECGKVYSKHTKSTFVVEIAVQDQMELLIFLTHFLWADVLPSAIDDVVLDSLLTSLSKINEQLCKIYSG
jgi:hypothetical protein